MEISENLVRHCVEHNERGLEHTQHPVNICGRDELILCASEEHLSIIDSREKHSPSKVILQELTVDLSINLKIA